MSSGHESGYLISIRSTTKTSVEFGGMLGGLPAHGRFTANLGLVFITNTYMLTSPR